MHVCKLTEQTSHLSFPPFLPLLSLPFFISFLMSCASLSSSEALKVQGFAVVCGVQCCPMRLTMGASSSPPDRSQKELSKAHVGIGKVLSRERAVRKNLQGSGEDV